MSRQTEPVHAELLGLVDLIKAQGKSGSTLPIGWKDSFFMWTSIPGWLMTALALSLGAPFWFDLLNKVTNVRNGIAKPGNDTEGSRPGK